MWWAVIRTCPVRAHPQVPRRISLARCHNLPAHLRHMQAPQLRRPLAHHRKRWDRGLPMLMMMDRLLPSLCSALSPSPSRSRRLRLHPHLRLPHRITCRGWRMSINLYEFRITLFHENGAADPLFCAPSRAVLQVLTVTTSNRNYILRTVQ